VDLIVEGNELVIGTHGRGFWVLDDIAPLRQANPAVLASDAHLFTPPIGVRSGPGVVISWWLKSAPRTARLEILDSAGAVVRTYEPDTARTDSARVDSARTDSARAGAARRDTARAAASGGRRETRTFLPNAAGLNRIVWDLRAQGIESFPGMILWGARTDGPALPPGRYTIRLTADGRSLTRPVAVVRNPWISDVSDADLRAQYAFSRRVRDRASEANRAVIAIRRVKAQVDNRLGRSKDPALERAARALTARASAVEEQIYQVRNQSGQDPLNFPIRVNNRLATLLSMAERGDGRPTNNMPAIFAILSAELDGYLSRLADVWKTDLAATNRELTRLALPALDPQCVKVEGCA
jgi:hypothetical protein